MSQWAIDFVYAVDVTASVVSLLWYAGVVGISLTAPVLIFDLLVHLCLDNEEDPNEIKE